MAPCPCPSRALLAILFGSAAAERRALALRDSEALQLTGAGGAGPHDPEGRCPRPDKAARLAAAQEIGGSTLRGYQKYAESKAWLWKDGETRPINPATDVAGMWKKIGQASELVRLFPAFAGNRTEFFLNVARLTCWGPAPFVDGPMSFKYDEVVPRLVDPGQRRGYYTATTPQSASFFNPEMIIFLDGERHATARALLNRAGFASLYPLDGELAALVRAIPAGGEDLAGVQAAVAPALFRGLWGQAPGEETLEHIRAYGKVGGYGFFGAKGEAVLHYAGARNILPARQAVSAWAATTPFAGVLRAAAAEHFPGEPLFADAARLLQDVVDLALFAGLLGTSDMVNACVVSQRRDAEHQALFRADPERYLVELMRLDSAVTDVTELLEEVQAFDLSGRRLAMAEGTPRQLVLATASRDPAHFADPDRFDPSRAELGDALAWNGRAADVEARDEARAPRGCPGYCLSLKVGAAVCAQLTGSFEDLLREGKVGGEVRCSNFARADA